MVIRSSSTGREWSLGLSGFLLGMTLLYTVSKTLCFAIVSFGSAGFDGYDFAPGDWDIQRNEHVLVEPAIVDYDVVGDHIVGLRHPIRRFECNEGREFRVKLVNRLHYFVLRADANVVHEFVSKANFHKKLVELGIDEDVSLDYTEAQHRWSRVDRHYGHVDYSMCTEILGG